MNKALWIGCLLILSGCLPCRIPDICMPTCFSEGVLADHCDGDEVNIARWWDQFNDPFLTELIERGICCNHDLRIAREHILEARARYRIQFSTLLPHLDGELFYTRTRNSETLTDSSFLGGNFINFFWTGFDAIWEVDLFGKNIDYSRAACLDVAASIAEVRDVHVLVASEVAVAYIMARTIQEQIVIAENHIRNEQELLEIVEERHKVGIVSELDVQNARALLYEREAELPRLQAELKETVFGLAVLIGMDPETLAPFFCETRPIPQGIGKIPLGIPSELLCRRGDVRRDEFTMRAAGVRVRASRKEFFPTLNLLGDFGWATGFFTQWFKAPSRNFNFLPFLTLPLFHGGEILANVDANTAVQRQATLTYEKTVLTALKEVETALVGYFKEGERIHALTKEVEANKQARQLSQILYQGGIVDFLNVIATERDLFFSQNLLTLSEGRMMTQLVAIYKALGGGWECCGSP